jgi:predicted cobalt transporter CbtA
MKLIAITGLVAVLVLAALALLVAPFLSPIPEPDDEHGRR